MAAGETLRNEALQSMQMATAPIKATRMPRKFRRCDSGKGSIWAFM